MHARTCHLLTERLQTVALVVRVVIRTPYSSLPAGQPLRMSSLVLPKRKVFIVADRAQFRMCGGRMFARYVKK